MIAGTAKAQQKRGEDITFHPRGGHRIPQYDFDDERKQRDLLWDNRQAKEARKRVRREHQQARWSSEGPDSPPPPPPPSPSRRQVRPRMQGDGNVVGLPPPSMPGTREPFRPPPLAPGGPPPQFPPSSRDHQPPLPPPGAHPPVRVSASSKRGSFGLDPSVIPVGLRRPLQARLAGSQQPPPLQFVRTRLPSGHGAGSPDPLPAQGAGYGPPPPGAVPPPPGYSLAGMRLPPAHPAGPRTLSPVRDVESEPSSPGGGVKSEPPWPGDATRLQERLPPVRALEVFGGSGSPRSRAKLL